MRVITGRAKGHKLSVPSGLDVRPTLDRVKEPMFSILAPYLLDAVVLDLFAGSGALGIEALSRGAKRCVFVDASKRSYDCVLQNLEHTRLLADAEVFLSDWEHFLKRSTETFDLIFLDPPYSQGIEQKVLSVIAPRLSAHGVIVLETEYEPSITGFTVFRSARYGRVFLSFLKKDDGDENSSVSRQL